MDHSKDIQNKETLGFINSLFWFSMDAFWMLAWNNLAIFMAVPTVLSGLWLVVLEKRTDVKMADISTFFWIIMNTTWLISEILGWTFMLTISKVSLVIGLIFLAYCFLLSDDIHQTMSRFKRFRIKQLKGFGNQKNNRLK